MGEIANDIIEGLCCAECGIYFRESHGYPVVCFSCGKGRKDKELLKLGLQRATIKEM